MHAPTFIRGVEWLVWASRCRALAGASNAAFLRGLLASILLVVCTLVSLMSCSKVPLKRYFPETRVAVSSWFAREQTLFLFWDLSIDEGFADDAVVEISVRTENGETGFRDVQSFPSVHRHSRVKCGSKALCGSQSVAFADRVLSAEMRVRFKRDGRLSDEIPLVHQSIESGQTAQTLSAALYGVFDQANEVIQWRLRHQIPGLPNAEVRRLGLNRRFKLVPKRYGERLASERQNRAIPDGLGNVNPYAFGFDETAACPAGYAAEWAGALPVETEAPARWSDEPVPAEGRTAAVVCAEGQLEAASGEIPVHALALRNPETETAYGQLATSVRPARLLKFLLAPCGRTISEDHLNMQAQRLLMDRTVDVCLERTSQDVMQTRMASAFAAALDAERVSGEDMALLIAFHHDDPSGDGVWHRALKGALESTLEYEQSKSSPRGVGAYVFDSLAAGELPQALSRQVLWCPSVPPPGRGRRGHRRNRRKQKGAQRLSAFLPACTRAWPQHWCV